MNTLSLLLKPSSSKCNLKCKYCFYHNISEIRDVSDYGFMSEQTMQNIIEKSIVDSPQQTINFAFQGGEPMLIGLDFYRKFVSTVKNLNSMNKTINYSMQTNGMLINDDWADFFSKNKFLLGVSLDGTKDTHNINRINYTNEDTHKKVLKSLEILTQKNVEFNILTVVTNKLAKHARQVYQYYRKKNYNHIQFIPCLEPLDQTQSIFAVTPSEYLKFLKIIFDLWYTDITSDNFVSIRMFDNVLGQYIGFHPESCDMVGYCTIQNVIEADGSVYPCDFYVIDEFLLGNINTNSFQDFTSHDRAKNFIESSKEYNSKCLNCKWFRICRGGCKRHQDQNLLNKFCETYYEFYTYAHDRFQHLAVKITQNTRKSRG